MTTQSFSALGVPADLVVELDIAGITTPTPIQAATLPDSLAGRDVLGRGRTGSGKTLAFLLPLVTRLKEIKGRPAAQRPRALILAPTRELATQINDALSPLAHVTGLTSCTVFGGVSQAGQVKAIKRGVDVVVACPGRLEDLMRQHLVNLDDVAITVLDEADHMADLGFLPGVKRILAATPKRSQRLLFSATLDGAINQLVKTFLHQPVTHEADSAQSPVATMTHHILHVSNGDHLAVLADLAAAPGRCVVFARTKHRAKKLARQLNAKGVPAVELHGNLSQNARTRTMDAFHSGKAATLVATDIAARGIHVDDVGLVIHADPPMEHKAYLHRSGRTARAGSEGTVVTLMTDEQRRDVRQLTRKAGIKAKTTTVDPNHPMLRTIAPGTREVPGAFVIDAPATTGGGGAGRGGGGRRGRGRGRAAGASGAGSRTGSGGGSSRRPTSGGASSRSESSRGGSAGGSSAGRSSSRPSTTGRATTSRSTAGRNSTAGQRGGGSAGSHGGGRRRARRAGGPPRQRG